MVLSLVNVVVGKEMERGHHQPSTSRRTERKIIEKNRRNRMKHLYSVLNSLLPSQPPDQEAKSLPDQIDDAIRYIKGLETAVKEAKDKKENLMGKKRPSSSTNSSTSAAIKSPQIEIRVKDSSLEVILTSGLHDQFIFSEILRMLHEEKVEVLNANFSIVGNSAYHLVHAKIGESNLGAEMISKRLKTFVNGSATYGEMLWDLQGPWVLETHFGVAVKPNPDELAHVYGSLFVQFNPNAKGSVDLEEFKADMKRMMLAMADELGFLPVQMVLEEDSFLKKAVDRELTKLPA